MLFREPCFVTSLHSEVSDHCFRKLTEEGSEKRTALHWNYMLYTPHGEWLFVSQTTAVPPVDFIGLKRRPKRQE